MSKIIGVIPSRWASTRFPGKSLAPIAGKPLLTRVIDRVKMAKCIDAVVVATDDDRIRSVAESCGVEVCMTREDHPSGTDRVAEAAADYGADIVINIQGDEPLMDPKLVDAIANALQRDETLDMATAVNALSAEEVEDPSIVKAVFDRDDLAMYFSRAPIPFYRDDDVPRTYWRHLGIYGYRKVYLERLVKEPPSALEVAEKLEQLRALQLGCRMKIVKTEAVSLGVDTPADVEKVEAVLREQEAP